MKRVHWNEYIECITRNGMNAIWKYRKLHILKFKNNSIRTSNSTWIYSDKKEMGTYACVFSSTIVIHGWITRYVQTAFSFSNPQFEILGKSGKIDYFYFHFWRIIFSQPTICSFNFILYRAKLIFLIIIYVAKTKIKITENFGKKKIQSEKIYPLVYSNNHHLLNSILY